MHLFLGLRTLGFRWSLAPAETFNGAGVISFRSAALHVRATYIAGPITATLAIPALDQPGVVPHRTAACMLRAKNHAVAIPRAIGQRVAKAYGYFEKKYDEAAQYQVHGEVL
ncbi:MAG: hypothetical protein ABI547_10750 [Betaproteobacteria bacterium]